MVQIFVQHWGYNLQFYPNFALFLTLKGMNLDHDFFQVSKLSQDQRMEHFFPGIQVKTKKKVLTKNGTLFDPNSGKDLHSDAHQNQIIGGNADEDHTQIIGVNAVKLLGGYIPPFPLGFWHPWPWGETSTLVEFCCFFQ